ncbi:unnamed protein product [Polarella glacialis]|uniref:Uncharacterized protein n=1 Tax=Polarella glacialis TaxID=89957 RepID=A0A813GYX9_POLGL|nr:unnamed protein product [Polarella glacialis]
MTLIRWPGIFISEDDLDEKADTAQTLLRPTAGEEVTSQLSSSSKFTKPVRRARSADERRHPSGTVAASLGHRLELDSLNASSRPRSPSVGSSSTGALRPPRLEPVLESDADSPMHPNLQRLRLPLTPLVDQSAQGNMQSELLLNTVRSSCDHHRPALGAVGGGGSAVIIPASARQRSLGSRTPPTGLMVMGPAGSRGSAADSKPSSSSAVGSALGASLPLGSSSAGGKQWALRADSARSEPVATPLSGSVSQSVSLPQASCTRCSCLGHELETLQEELERERLQNKSRSELAGKRVEQEVQRRVASAVEAERERLRKEHLEQKATGRSEAEAGFKAEIRAAAAARDEAERRCQDKCEEYAAKHARAVVIARDSKQHAAEVERQRKDLTKQTGVISALKLREDLAEATTARAELNKQLKKALPRIDRLVAEEKRLLQALSEESEAVRAQEHSFKEEAAELAKVKEQLQKLRKSARGQAERLEVTEADLAEADKQRRAAQVELSKSQRTTGAAQKARQSVISERDSLQAEVAELKASLKAAQASASTRDSEVSRGVHSVTSLRDHGHGLSRSSRSWASDDRDRGDRTPVDEAPPPSWSDASVRLFQMIELAKDTMKERADQRRELSGAAEEVKEKARALEELLAKDQFT